MTISLAEVHRRVVFGASNGRIIWQLRISCWIHDKRFAGQKLPEPFERMTMPEMYRELRYSPRIYQYDACFKRIKSPSVVRRQRPLNETDTEVSIETPVGKPVEVRRKSKSSPHIIHVKWETATEEEMKAATWRTENTTWEWDQAKYEALQAEWGDLGAPTMYIPRVNIQDLFINTMGVRSAIYVLYDWPYTVTRLASGRWTNATTG